MTMGRLDIFYKNKTIKYLINMQVSLSEQEKVINDILKHFPPDVEFDIKELY
jgi:hypothetical protein